MDTAAAIRDYPAGDQRVSDADRDRAVCELSEAFQAGRITAAEFDQRSGEALRARTGQELTVLLADLPRDGAAAARGIAVQQCVRVLATRIVIGASAVTAISLAAVSASNALSNNGGNGDTSQKRELAREILAREGISLPRGFKFPASPGFDWAGTITPAAIAVLLVALIIFLCLARPGRPRTARKAR